MISTEQYICPRCLIPLKENKMAQGIFWSCGNCGGRAVTVELLRRTFTPESINPLWLHAIRGEGLSSVGCPLCRRQMLQVALADGANVNVDVCRSCHFVWFDAHEVESLAPKSATEISRDERERLAAEKMKRFHEQIDRYQINDTPAAAVWSTIADILRLHVWWW